MKKGIRYNVCLIFAGLFMSFTISAISYIFYSSYDDRIVFYTSMILAGISFLALGIIKEDPDQIRIANLEKEIEELKAKQKEE